MVDPVQVATFVMTFATALHYAYYIVILDCWANWLYSKGLLTRCKTSIKPMEKGRRTWSMTIENFYISFTTFYPSVWLLVSAYYYKIHTLDFTFNFVQTYISLLAIYIAFDTWYYFSHRFVHETPYLYKAIHKRHHDTLPVDAYLSGRAELIENILFVTPGLSIWVALCSYFMPTPNFWSLAIPIIALLHDFTVAHVGFYDTLLLYMINPFSLVMQYSLGARGLSSRHELHHNLVNKNYGPMIPWLDRIFGTGKEFGPEHWNITVASEAKK